MPGSAGPSSGKQYGGFGSEDIARLGYNQENKFNAPYDPYTKSQSATGVGTYAYNNDKTKEDVQRKKSDVKKKRKKNKKKKKSKKDDSSDSDVTSSSDEDSDSSSSEDSADDKKKSKKKKKDKAEKKGLAEAPKATRMIGGVSVTDGTGTVAVQPEAPKPTPSPQDELMDLFKATPTTTQQPAQQ